MMPVQAVSREGAQPLLPEVRPHHPLGCDWLQLLTTRHLMMNKNAAERSASRERREKGRLILLGPRKGSTVFIRTKKDSGQRSEKLGRSSLSGLPRVK